MIGAVLWIRVVRAVRTKTERKIKIVKKDIKFSLFRMVVVVVVEMLVELVMGGVGGGWSVRRRA